MNRKKTEKTKILYPFVFSDYGYENEIIVQRIKKQPDAIVVINKQGPLSELFDKAGISYFILPLKKMITPRTFYPVVLWRLVSSSLSLFRFVREVGPFKALFFHDLTTALCWSGTTKMGRIPYIVSMSKLEAFSKYATIVLSDASFLLCPCPFIKESTPGRFHQKMFVVPFVPSFKNILPAEIRRSKKRSFKDKNNKSIEQTFVIMTDALHNDDRVVRFASVLELETGQKTGLLHTDDYKTGKELSVALAGCHLFLGVKSFNLDPFALFAAMRAEVPVFSVRQGLYMDVISDGESGVFFKDDTNMTENAVQTAEFFKNVTAVDTLKKTAAEQVEIIYQKTLDFMKKLYDSI